MNLDTLKTVIAASHVMSDDATRIHLEGVLVSAIDPIRVRVSATDGHKLSQVDTEDSSLAKLIGNRKFFFDSDAIKSLKLIVKHGKGIEVLESSLEGDTLTVSTIAFKAVAHATKDFPDFAPLFPRYPETPTQICLNAEYLLELAKAICENPKRAPHIILTIKGSLDPVLVTAVDGDHCRQGLVMPVRAKLIDRVEAPAIEGGAA